jgi:hypothetical protein
MCFLPSLDHQWTDNCIKLQSSSPANRWSSTLGVDSDRREVADMLNKSPPIATSCQELTKCSYEQNCKKRCKCFRIGQASLLMCLWALKIDAGTLMVAYLNTLTVCKWRTPYMYHKYHLYHKSIQYCCTFSEINYNSFGMDFTATLFVLVVTSTLALVLLQYLKASSMYS